MNDQHRQELLRASAVYATAKLSFANAIVILARLLTEREQIERSLTYHHAEQDWLYRCKEYIGGSDNHNPRAEAHSLSA